MTTATVQGITMEEMLRQSMELNVALMSELREMRNGGVAVAKKNGRGGRKTAVPQLDTKTGKVYHSKAAAGMAVAPEYGLVVNNFVWYEVIKLAPKRFVDYEGEVKEDGQVVAKPAPEMAKVEAKIEQPKTAPVTQAPTPTQGKK